MDNLPRNCLLTINGGSSSIKYALYEIKQSLNQLLSGEMEGIWSGQAQLHFTHADGVKKHHIDIPVTNHTEAAEWLFNWLQKETEYIKVTAIGHRIVQGMKHTAPEKITDEFLVQLKAISAFDPEHLPAEIELIEVFRKRYPDVDQVACFDTYFHTSMPAIAKLKNGERKRGEKKDGEQMHIQIIVSRKDITDKIKLSPMNTSRGKNENHSQKLGQFNRVAFKQCGEELFDKTFSFSRTFKETASYAMIQKNGDLAQKEKLDVLAKGVAINPNAKQVAFKLAKEISMERNPAFFSDFFKSNSKEVYWKAY